MFGIFDKIVDKFFDNSVFKNLKKKTKASKKIKTEKRKYTKRTYKEKDMIKDYDPIFLFGDTYKK